MATLAYPIAEILLAAAARLAAFMAAATVTTAGVQAIKNAHDKAKEEDQAKSQAKPIAVAQCPQKKEPCPVCKKGVNPTPGVIPPYANAIPPRTPKDSETNPPLTLYERKGIGPKGARIWRRPDGKYCHLDTFHKGPDSEIEIYDRRGNHLGSICPHCGAPVGPPKGYSLKGYRI